MKRSDYISYHSAFMTMAIIASYRSKDPNTQHGCIIINNENRLVSMGYNGFPNYCSDNNFPWTSPEKYDYAEHAERNAIYNATNLGVSLKDCIMYLYSPRGYFPCSDCARAIVQVGIKKVYVCGLDKNDTSDNGKYNWGPTKAMFEASGVSLYILPNISLNINKISNMLKETEKQINTYA